MVEQVSNETLLGLVIPTIHVNGRAERTV